MSSKEIYILNNEYKVIVFFGTIKKLKKVLRKFRYPKNIDVENMVANKRGVCFHSQNRHPVIAMPKKPETPAEYGTLAHESVHAIDFIFDAIGQYDRGEAFAHSVGAVVRGALT